MGIELMELGSGPSSEELAQVGDEDYEYRASAECRAWRAQLRRTFGVEPRDASLVVKTFIHELGWYYELVCYYDDDNVEATAYAYKVEGNSPKRWDTQAKAQLNKV